MELYLSAKHVRKNYGDFVALKDVSLDLHRGEILALLGPNGAGKTTFIKILATLITKDGGDVEIMGHNLDTHENTIRHLFGYVGQDTDRSAYARLTVRENLHFFGALRGMTRGQIDAQIDKLASYFDFHTNLDKMFMNLSGGQKQTTVIMRSLLYDPPIVYLDEPTKGLDPIVAKKIRAFLKQYTKEESRSMLLTSHILTEVDEMADRVALIHGGTIPVVDTPEHLKQAIGVQGFIELRKDSLKPQIREQILELDPVLSCTERDPEWVSFGIADPLDGVEAIIDVLRKHDMRIPFRHGSISLEDAFTHQIGALTEKFD